MATVTSGRFQGRGLKILVLAVISQDPVTRL